MKPGQEYEDFVYERLSQFLPDAKLKVRDNIRGSQSKRLRELDVSIKIHTDDKEFLIIVQCKDYGTRKTDLNTLGELSSVMKDVGAIKGLLLCTSGFAKSNHDYALSLGIELITIEDIESEKWKVDINIPVYCTVKSVSFYMSPTITSTRELADLNKVPLSLSFTQDSKFRSRGNRNERSLKEIMDPKILSEGISIYQQATDISEPDMELEILPSVWVPVSDVVVRFNVSDSMYVTSVKPSKHIQLRDHVRNTTIPLNASIENIPLLVDESWEKLEVKEIPANDGLTIQLTTWE